MIAGVPALDLFGVRLIVESVDAEDPVASVRCEIETHRLQAVTRLEVGVRQAEDRLNQVERQYTDFNHAISWVSNSGPSELDLTWTLNANGHAQGHFALESPHWRAEGALDGDQSYLPKLALGLRLLLRAIRGEPL